jgi:Zn-dependent alcohol dehydrogenase
VKAVVLREVHGPLVLEDIDLAEPRAHEVLVRVRAAGICHSDWHLVTGASPHPLPVVPGHEGAGVVERVGEKVSNISPGDHVILNQAPACGTCYCCAQDTPNLCEDYAPYMWRGTLLDGTTRMTANGEPIHHFSCVSCFAERTVVPEVGCVRIDPGIPFDVAALVGCAVTTGVGSVLETAKVTAGETVAVFGVGGVGGSAVLGARLAKAAAIVAIDTTAAKLEFGRDLGATETVLYEPNISRQIERLFGRGVDVAIEASGTPGVQEIAVECVRPGGRAVLVGIVPKGHEAPMLPERMTRQEKAVVGSYLGTSIPARDFPRYLDLYEKGGLDVGRLLRRRYTLDQTQQAYDDLLAGAPGRGVVYLPA